jgi:hypothetical protein
MLVGRIGSGPQIRRTQASGSSPSKDTPTFTPFESDADGARWVGSKTIPSLGSGLALMRTMTD